MQLCNLPALFFLAFAAAVFSVSGGFKFLLEAEDGGGVRREGLGVLEGADAGLGFFERDIALLDFVLSLLELFIAGCKFLTLIRVS